LFDSIRTAITRPDLLVAGEQAVTLITPTPDDELLPAELARLDRTIDAADAERRRLIDLLQGGFIRIDRNAAAAPEIASRRKELQHKRTRLVAEGATLARGNQLRSRVHEDVIRYRRRRRRSGPGPRRWLIHWRSTTTQSRRYLSRGAGAPEHLRIK
jgi:hypothetical protein